MKIKTGDNVKVMAGKDRGKTGKVIQVFQKDKKVVVEKVNILVKHIRSRQQGQSGQRIELPAPLSMSNVQVICPACNKPTRVGYEGAKKDKKRVCKKCSKDL